MYLSTGHCGDIDKCVVNFCLKTKLNKKIQNTLYRQTLVQ